MIFFIVFPFLAIGCVTFLICSVIPPLRRFTLSASLWCVACIPCLMASLIMCGLSSIGLHKILALLQWNNGSDITFHQTSWSGWLFFFIVLIAVIAGATIITLLHGIIIRRLTLALFRIYVGAVSFGVGVSIYLLLSLTFAMRLLEPARYLPAALLGFLFAVSLAYVCFKNASLFRGPHPTRLPIVTLEEFGPED